MTIDHIFVLMLENRSFDQMLGLSEIQGTDAVTGKLAQIEGLTGSEQNASQKGMITVTRRSGFVADADPGHEFPNVREQLCGAADYSVPTPPKGSVDPNIKNSGFVSSFAGKYPSKNWATPMMCFAPDQLPVLVTLAKEFAVCDHWFSSIPGPTWPNRFFLHAASSGGLDHSPNLLEEMGVPYRFTNGTIFDLLDKAKLDWVIYAGDEFPQALHMDGMMENLAKGNFKSFEDFANDLKAKGFAKSYVFIEPDWHPFTKFKGGNSQHPLDDVTRGELLLKQTYEAIRNSPIWEESLLIITYDEHGGFYDHVAPPIAIDPGDKTTSPFNNKFGFNFQQLGVRVPTIVVSPYISKGVIDKRVYDHSSIPATIEERFGLPSLTQRDKQANRLTDLLELSEPRSDAPLTLPSPVTSGVQFGFLDRIKDDFEKVLDELGFESGEQVDPALAGFVHVALMRKLSSSSQLDRSKVIGEAQTVKSNVDAVRYIHKVRNEVPDY